MSCSMLVIGRCPRASLFIVSNDEGEQRKKLLCRYDVGIQCRSFKFDVSETCDIRYLENIRERNR